MGKKTPKSPAKRRQFTAEYRGEALLLADKVGVAQAARELGLHESQLYAWRGKAKTERNRSDLEKQQAVEIARLKRQLAEQAEDIAILKKLQRTSPKIADLSSRAKYAFIPDHRASFTITAMCRVLGVCRSGYYGWQKRRVAGRNHGSNDAQIDALVAAAFSAQKARSGSPRLTLDISEAGHHHDRKTIAKSMKRQGLVAKAAKKFKVTTDSEHGKPVAANVLGRDFSAQVANQKWVGDITYLWTDEGWLYLAVVLDLYSRKIVGWAMKERMTASLVCDALTMALWRRGFPKHVVVHSDRGSQYCSKRYQDLLTEHKLVCSMSGVGNCYDNACAESFFHSLKVECIHGERFPTRSQMRQTVFEYIEVDYNRNRRHSAIGMISPDSFEARNVA